MPLVVRCKECGHVLYSGVFLIRSSWKSTKPIALKKIADKHEGKCPSCDRALEPSKSKVIGVSPIDEP